MKTCRECQTKISDAFTYCSEHNPNTKANAKVAAKANKLAAKIASDVAAVQRAKAEKLRKDLDALAVARAAEARKKIQDALIKTQAGATETAIDLLVLEVRALQALNPGRDNINAGENAGLRTITGGTENEYSITAQSPVTKSEITNYLLGTRFLENSHSGILKHRTSDDIFIHVK